MITSLQTILTLASTEEPQAQNQVSSEESRNQHLAALPKKAVSNCSELFEFIFKTVFLRSGAEPMPKNVMFH